MLLTARRRRRRQRYEMVADEKPRFLLRGIIGVIIVAIIWYGGGAVLSFFTDASQQRASAVLTVGGPNDVQVSLQGGEALRAEDGLKIYAGDTIFTRFGGSAVLTFFDGSKLLLDQETEVELLESIHDPIGESELSIEIPQGRGWIQTASDTSFTGSITRMTRLPYYDAMLPYGTEGLLSRDLVFFTKTSGIGVEVELQIPDREGETVVVGEGQQYVLNETAQRDMQAGEDVYAFRDPIAKDALADPFVRKSATELSAIGSLPSGSGTVTSDDISSTDELLTVTSPDNNATVRSSSVIVSGRVASTQVQSVQVNGYAVAINENGTFSEELALPDKESVILTIEARNGDDIVIASETRTLERVTEAPNPPTISTPGGSGDTVTTTETEFEITGGAAPNTVGIIVNDYRLQLFEPGDRTWSYLASTELNNLQFGTNEFTVYAVDSFGNKSAPARITINLESTQPSGGTGSSASSTSSATQTNNAPLQPGTLTVNAPSPTSPYTTKESEVLIEGDISTDTHTITVNGYQLRLHDIGDDFWNYIASTEYETLKPGRNVYDIVTRDANGNILDRMEYVIIYEN